MCLDSSLIPYFTTRRLPFLFRMQWQTLPMSLMKHFDCTLEWTLMQIMWYKSNLKGFTFNLTNLSNDSCIKSRKSVHRVLNRLVKKGWITKAAIGTKGQHHKYSLNRTAFQEWACTVSNDSISEEAVVQSQMTPDSPKVSNDSIKRSQMTPDSMSNDSVQIIKDKIQIIIVQ